MKNITIFSLIIFCFLWLSCKYETEQIKKIINLSPETLVVCHHPSYNDTLHNRDTILPNQELKVLQYNQTIFAPDSSVIDTIQTINQVVIKKRWKDLANWEQRTYNSHTTSYFLFFIREEDL